MSLCSITGTIHCDSLIQMLSAGFPDFPFEYLVGRYFETM